jgi:uncharacterized protein YdhG (YjbR/CyaY superfamily)
MTSPSKPAPAADPGGERSAAPNDPVRAYIDGIPEAYRGLFDRLRRLVESTCPDAELALSYKMPTFMLGHRRLYVGVWRHGISMYGWTGGHDGGFLERHPNLRTGKGTVRLRPQDAASVSDDELCDLIRSALSD